jgi:FMN-dependent NADH-azoreductase
MSNILQLDTSIFSDQGFSSVLANELVVQLANKSEQSLLVHKDFAKHPIPHFDANYITAISTAENERTETQKSLAAFSDQLIAELKAADNIVIGLPMYNFGIPSTLKAWFDHVARAGTTFKYTETGPQGLLTGKKVYLVTTRGGIHKDSAQDTQIPFVKTFLAFLGLTDVEVIYAEGLNLGNGQREKGLETARKLIESVAA